MTPPYSKYSKSDRPKDESLLLTRERVRHDWQGLVLDVRVTERRIFEGHGHQGLSAVVQVLGHPARRGKQA